MDIKSYERDGINDSSSVTSDEAKDRYSRQERFAPIGVTGQAKLREAHVLVIGAGALGTGISEILARSGIGHLTIADRDYVEWSNLQRQQLFSEEDARGRMPKAVAARQRLEAINSVIKIDAQVMDVTAESLNSLVQGVHLIMDATDNFETRLIVNDISQKYNIPWIYGGCVGSYGMTFTILPGETPCLNCLLRTIPLGGDTCDLSGVIPSAVQMVVAHQTTEALKLLTGNKESLRGTLLSFDLWRNEQASIRVHAARQSDCPSCGEHATYPFLSSSHVSKTEVLCGRDTVQIRPPQRIELDLNSTAKRLRSLNEGKVELNPFLLSFTIQGRRMVIFKDGRALIHGTKDVAEAKSIYHRYFG